MRCQYPRILSLGIGDHIGRKYTGSGSLGSLSLNSDPPGAEGVPCRGRSGSDVEGRDLVVHEREAPDGVVVGVGDVEVVALEADAGRLPEGCVGRLAVLEAVAVSRHRLGLASLGVEALDLVVVAV